MVGKFTYSREKLFYSTVPVDMNAKVCSSIISIRALFFFFFFPNESWDFIFSFAFLPSFRVHFVLKTYQPVLSDTLNKREPNGFQSLLQLYIAAIRMYTDEMFHQTFFNFSPQSWLRRAVLSFASFWMCVIVNAELHAKKNNQHARWINNND